MKESTRNQLIKFATVAAIGAAGLTACGAGTPELLSCWQYPADEDGYGRADASVRGDIVEVTFMFVDGTRFRSDGYSNGEYRQSAYFDDNRLSTGDGDDKSRPMRFWTMFDIDNGDFDYHPTAPLASCEARTSGGETFTVIAEVSDS